MKKETKDKFEKIIDEYGYDIINNKSYQMQKTLFNTEKLRYTTMKEE